MKKAMYKKRKGNRIFNSQGSYATFQDLQKYIHRLRGFTTKTTFWENIRGNKKNSNFFGRKG